MSRQKCFLVCNAHLDPVWLWHWEDGMTETISTFRVAADFCDEHPDFVFNHNEALLYEWVERNDPELFARIRRLVRRGRWHIAGGSYVQPDLIAASGESILRQFLIAKNYFCDKFGVEPTTAYNFDSFGTPQGLIQILDGCGFDSYVFCRPSRRMLKLPVGSFRWRHASGAEVIARRSDDHYITQGKIRDAMKNGNWPAFYRSEGDFMFLWGIGNHGGGPSRAEYAQFEQMRADFPDVEFIESTPEAFFLHTLKVRRRGSLPVVRGDFKPINEGCYTSMQRVKAGHRRLENLMHLTEKLAAVAWWRRKKAYPSADFAVAWKDILFAEFHDFLPGSSIPRVEADALNLIGHCEEILRRKKAECEIALLRDEPPAERNATPIFVFNPHSWPVTQEVEIECCLDQQYRMDSAVRRLTHKGREVDAQFEKAEHNCDDPSWGDWRKKTVFLATVPPMSYQRFDTDYRVLPDAEIRPWTSPPLPGGNPFRVKTDHLEIAINRRTGLIDEVKEGGKRVLGKSSFLPLVFADLEHSWETWREWRTPIGRFVLSTPVEAARIMGSEQTNPNWRKGKDPLHIIEDGPVRLVVEAIFVFGASYVVQRYIINKRRPVLHVEQTIFWTEHDKMLRFELALAHPAQRIQAEKCYSIDAENAPLPLRGVERDFQHFLRFSGKGGPAFAVVSHGIHGYRRKGGHLQLSLLRSPAYSCIIAKTYGDIFHNRFIPRHDQGTHTNRITLLFGEKAASTAATARVAYEENVPLEPFVYFPTRRNAKGGDRDSFVSVSADNVLLTVLKKEETGDGLILRFWETGGKDTAFQFTVEGKAFRARIGAWRLKTFCLDRNGRLVETNLLEKSIAQRPQNR
jgi:alpha-mannosidase